MNSLVIAAAAETEKINHWIIGAIALAILLSAMAALLIFGKGREHS